MQKSRSRDPWQFLWESRFRYQNFWSRRKSLGIGIEKFGLVKKVSVSVLENLVSEKKSRYQSRKIWSRKKSLGIGIGKICLRQKVSVSVSVKNLVSSQSVSGIINFKQYFDNLWFYKKGWLPSAKLKPSFTFLGRDFPKSKYWIWQNPYQEK